MIDFILFTIEFSIGIVLGVWVGSMIILPLFYGMPRTIYYVLKRQLKARSILFYLVSPILWSMIFTILPILLSKFLPIIYDKISVRLVIGLWLGIIFLIGYSFLFPKGRQDINHDFWSSMERYKI